MEAIENREENEPEDIYASGGGGMEKDKSQFADLIEIFRKVQAPQIEKM